MFTVCSVTALVKKPIDVPVIFFLFAVGNYYSDMTCRPIQPDDIADIKLAVAVLEEMAAMGTKKAELCT